MEPWVSCILSHLLYGISVKIFIMNRYISKSYTTSKNTIERQYTERAAVVSTVTSINTLGSQCEAGLYWFCSIEFPPASLLQVNKTSNMKQENWNISLGGNQNFRVLLSKRCSWQQARLVHVATLFKGVVRFRSWTVLDVRTRYNVSLWTQWSLATRWKRFTFLCSI